MSRAARVWAAYSAEQRTDVSVALDGLGLYALVVALDADLAEQQRLTAALTAPPFQAFLIPEADAGPRLAPPRTGQCQCGREVTTELFAWVNGDGSITWLGPGCWRERALRRAQAAAGEQLQIGET